MSDLEDYINDRKKRDPEFAEGYDEGLQSFKAAVMVDLIEAERQIARGEVVFQEDAIKQIKENLAKWK